MRRVLVALLGAIFAASGVLVAAAPAEAVENTVDNSTHFQVNTDGVTDWFVESVYWWPQADGQGVTVDDIYITPFRNNPFYYEDVQFLDIKIINGNGTVIKEWNPGGKACACWSTPFDPDIFKVNTNCATVKARMIPDLVSNSVPGPGTRTTTVTICD